MFFLICLLWGGTADEVVAVVDNEPILASDVEAMAYLTYINNPFVQVSEDSLRQMLLERLISQKLIFKKAAQDTTIELNYGEIAQNADQELDFFYRNVDTLPEILDSLRAWGLTRERLRGILTNEGKFQAIVQHMLFAQGKTQPYVSPNEILNYYEENKDSIAVLSGYIKMAHIALSITPSSSELARIEAKFNDIMVLLSRGGEFDLIAESYSEDPRTRTQGGSLGWVKKGELLPEIDTVLFSIPTGQPVGPVQSRDGFHIFLVERKLPDKVYARHILLKPNVTRQDTLRTMRKASEIRDEIVSDELTFEEAARLYSEDFATSDQGGYIGEALLENLTPPFDSIAAVLDSGQVSQPFLTEFGVHLLYAMDKREERILSFDEMQVELRNILAMKKHEEWLEELVDEAKAEFYVEKKDL
ncbi:peptidylprolyl isomerase [candidate division WOR-3 bacterium]|nr:peptidylprolyl isomerase [candidate division WOR-3 bacterium]